MVVEQWRNLVCSARIKRASAFYALHDEVALVADFIVEIQNPIGVGTRKPKNKEPRRV
tara:strand:- start:1668 stop:1841 length:174 start_codon:yes stop_codon:yes gene_type:complete